MKLSADRAGLPGNVDMITGSALTPVLESVTALPAYKAEHPADFPVTVRSEGSCPEEEFTQGHGPSMEPASFESYFMESSGLSVGAQSG